MYSKTWLSRNYKFILENITIFSVSSDDFFHAFLEVAEQQMWTLTGYLIYIYTHTHTHTHIYIYSYTLYQTDRTLHT